MAQGDKVRGLLGALDAGQACGFEHVAFGQRSRAPQPRGKGAAQDDDGLGARQARSRHLGGHVHHASAAGLVEMREERFFHVTR